MVNKDNTIKTKVIFYRILGFVIFFILWELVTVIIGQYKLPSLIKICSRFFSILYASSEILFQGGGNSGILPHLLYTFQRTIIGCVLGISLGIGIGLFMSWNKNIGKFLEPIIEIIRTIPPLAAIPFFILWFGPGAISQYVMLIFYCFFMVVINTIEAIKHVNPIYIKYAMTFGATRGQIFKSIIIPAIIPELSGGVRVVIGAAWGIEVVTELMGSPKGIGQIHSMMLSLSAMDIIILAIIWIVIFALFFDFSIKSIMKYITKWVPRS